MAHIYIYSPSGAVRDKHAFKRGISRLKKLGHAVEVDADALNASTRFAGDDATRIAAIHRAASKKKPRFPRRPNPRIGGYLLPVRTVLCRPVTAGLRGSPP